MLSMGSQWVLVDRLNAGMNKGRKEGVQCLGDLMVPAWVIQVFEWFSYSQASRVPEHKYVWMYGQLPCVNVFIPNDHPKCSVPLYKCTHGGPEWIGHFQ